MVYFVDGMPTTKNNTPGCNVGGKEVRDKGRNGSKDKGRIETGIAERARNKGRRDTGENNGQV